jgi:hypothetical protein
MSTGANSDFLHGTESVPENYLIEHTVGSIITGAFKIYSNNLGTLFLIFVLPILPMSLIQAQAQRGGNFVLQVLVILLSTVVTLFAYSAMTVAVADVCLGNTPSVKRSYARILGKLPLLLLLTNLLQALVTFAGLLLLIIPGLVLLVWLMTVPSVVVLEGKSGIAALKRSKQLGDGLHWRNVGLFLLLMVVVVAIGGGIGIVIGILRAFFPEVLNETIFLGLVISLQQGLFAPLGITVMILIYYDERVRKEGYDVMALAQDLAR